MFVTVDEVIKSHGLKPSQLGFEKDHQAELEELITEWISQSEDLIKQYTNNNFTDPVPGTVKYVCRMITSNMISISIQRRDTPIIKVNDWTINIGNLDVFPDELRRLLDPFKKERKSYKSDPVTCYAITGDD